MQQPPLIFLFTDFGWSGPYVGQMAGAILGAAPGSVVVSLMHDAPSMRPDLAAYLLPACCRSLPSDSIVIAVVDPGVGGERAVLLVETGSQTFVGPDNGLLSRLNGITRVRRIDWRPETLSSSFHGRDLFAPVAAMLAAGKDVAGSVIGNDRMVGADWPSDLEQVVFVDAYGNLMTGIDARNLLKKQCLRVAGQSIAYAETFCRVPVGEVFWYPNSLGLVEIAVNRGSAAARLKLALGDKILLD